MYRRRDIIDTYLSRSDLYSEFYDFDELGEFDELDDQEVGCVA